MSADRPGALYPTPTRRALLAAVDAGQVVNGDGGTFLIDGPDARQVRDRIAELAAAGWVELPVDQGVTWTWRLTDVGRDVLATAKRGRGGEQP